MNMCQKNKKIRVEIWTVLRLEERERHAIGVIFDIQYILNWGNGVCSSSSFRLVPAPFRTRWGNVTENMRVIEYRLAFFIFILYPHYHHVWSHTHDEECYEELLPRHGGRNIPKYKYTCVNGTKSIDSVNH